MKEEINETFNQMIRDNDNGNIREFKENLNKLSKMQLINFILEMELQTLYTFENIVLLIHKRLEW